MKNGIGPKTLVIGLVVGVLSIPTLVFAGTAAFGPDDDQVEAAEASTTTVAQTTSIPEEFATTTSTIFGPEADSSDHLAEACGEDGLSLVAAEANGSITEIQQAALDALRPLCEEAGLAFPAPTAPDLVVVETVVETTGQPDTTMPAVDDEYEHHDDDEDDEYEDDEDEDDHEDHEDEEDDHDEDDD